VTLRNDLHMRYAFGMKVLGLGLMVGCLAAAAWAQDVHVRVSPDVKTGIEGSTEFPTIQNALDHHPFAGPGGRVFIEIAPGVYRERIIVTQNHQNVTLLGMGKTPEETVITNSLNAKTAEINGNGFEAANLTFENTAGNTGQAVAAAVRADRAVFRHVRFLGHQDTLFADYGRQYYLECFITGGVDFIFGNAAAVFDKSELVSNGPGFLTAHSRTDAKQTTGYVILDSTVRSAFETAAPMDAATPGAKSTASAKGMVGLGRPWRPYSRVVYIDTKLDLDNLNPAGWNNWGKASNEATAYYGEYGSTGPGASAASRVSWAHALTKEQIKQYLPGQFLRGSDGWSAQAAAAKLP
jgi:pectinesterase